MIETRINVPSPFISIPLALSKINELAPDKIPEVGEWYEASLTEAGVYSENESSTQETTYLSNRTNVKGVGEGKDAEAEYTVTRQTRQLVGDAAKAAKAHAAIQNMNAGTGGVLAAGQILMKKCIRDMMNGIALLK